jgi:hypothetical protein
MYEFAKNVHGWPVKWPMQAGGTVLFRSESETMHQYEQRRFTAIALLSLLIAAITFIANLDSVRAQDTCPAFDQDQETVWTVFIPDGFPWNTYFWRLKPDGTYAEDGRDTLTGKTIQQTLSGRWTVVGTRMILRQDTLGYVFDGTITGDQYSGILYLGTQTFSRFSATKGDAAHPCKPPLVG